MYRENQRLACVRRSLPRRFLADHRGEPTLAYNACTGFRGWSQELLRASQALVDRKGARALALEVRRPLRRRVRVAVLREEEPQEPQVTRPYSGGRPALRDDQTPDLRSLTVRPCVRACVAGDRGTLNLRLKLRDAKARSYSNGLS